MVNLINTDPVLSNAAVGRQGLYNFKQILAAELTSKPNNLSLQFYVLSIHYGWGDGVLTRKCRVIFLLMLYKGFSRDGGRRYSIAAARSARFSGIA